MQDRKTLKTFLEEVHNQQKKIICFGTGVMAQEALQYEQIRQAVVAMADNDVRRQG